MSLLLAGEPLTKMSAKSQRYIMRNQKRFCAQHVAIHHLRNWERIM